MKELIDKLYQKIGEQDIELEFLKKIQAIILTLLRSGRQIVRARSGQLILPISG